jgi:trigger factor
VPQGVGVQVPSPAPPIYFILQRKVRNFSMHVEVTKTDGLTREVNLRVPKSRWDAQVEAELSRIAKTLRHAGFRPGKVPVNVIRPQYEKQVRSEALRNTISQSVDEAMRQINIKIAGQPAIKINSTGEEIDFTVTLDILPEIPAIDFSSITAEKFVVQLPDDLATKRLENLAQIFSKEFPAAADHAATWGDIVAADITIMDDTTNTIITKDENLRWILEDLEKKEEADTLFFGQKVGFTTTVQRDIFDILEPDVLKNAGAVTTHITIQGIQQIEPHPIDDNLAKKIGNETLAEAEEWIKKRTLAEFDPPIKNKLRLSLLNALDIAYSFELPPRMLADERVVVTRQLEKTADALTDTDKEEIDTLAKRRIKLGLVLGHLGNEQKITVSNEELNKAINDIIAKSPLSDRKNYLEFFRNSPQIVERISASIYEDKVTDWLLEKITVTEKPITMNEFIDLIKKDEDDEFDEEEHIHDEHCGHSH